MFKDATNNNSSLSNLLTAGTGLMHLLFIPVLFVLISRLGRKPLLIIGSSMIIFSHLVLAVFSYLKDENSINHSICSILIIIFIYFFEMSFFLSLGPIVWIYMAEILTEKV